MSKEDRKTIGLKGREFAMNNLSSKIMCDKMAEGVETTLANFTPKKKYNLYKIYFTCFFFIMFMNLSYFFRSFIYLSGFL